METEEQDAYLHSKACQMGCDYSRTKASSKIRQIIVVLFLEGGEVVGYS